MSDKQRLEGRWYWPVLRGIPIGAARTLRHTCKLTHSASVLNNRTPWDVASGPWRAVIDLLRIGYGGLGAARGQRSRKGAVRELPNLPFLTPATIPRQSKERLRRSTIFAI